MSLVAELPGWRGGWSCLIESDGEDDRRRAIRVLEMVRRKTLSPTG